DLEDILERTLGIPIFQEQLIQMATAVGDCTADEADLLRRAMGSKRGLEKIEKAFSNFGFAESHSLSFALLVYASSWLKLHYPAAFLAGLLRSQPMGFYSPATLTADARRHGVEVRRPDLHLSGATETLEPLTPDAAGTTGRDDCLADPQPPVHRFDRSAPDESAAHRRDGRYARREAIWLAGAAAEDRARFLPGTTVAVQPPLFADQTSYERLSADLWATGISTDDHPMTHFRDDLRARGVLTAADLQRHETGRRVEVAGLVTHRQRPATAAGVTFVNLEDESGLVNVICSTGVWGRFGRIARESPALIIRGILERSPEGVVNVLADAFEDLRTGGPWPPAVTRSVRAPPAGDGPIRLGLGRVDRRIRAAQSDARAAGRRPDGVDEQRRPRSDAHRHRAVEDTADPVRHLSSGLLAAAVADTGVQVEQRQDDGLLRLGVDEFGDLDTVPDRECDLTGEDEHPVHAPHPTERSVSATGPGAAQNFRRNFCPPNGGQED
ncbi:unnamed protein product, partial [Penicillium discolor]